MSGFNLTRECSLPEASVTVVNSTKDWWNFSKYFMERLSSISWQEQEGKQAHSSVVPHGDAHLFLCGIKNQWSYVLQPIAYKYVPLSWFHEETTSLLKHFSLHWINATALKFCKVLGHQDQMAQIWFHWLSSELMFHGLNPAKKRKVRG